MRYGLFVLILVSFFHTYTVGKLHLAHRLQGRKVLHLGFHKGCLDDFASIARELGVSVTSWYTMEPRGQLDGETKTDGIYNITSARAKKIWDTHKEYFDQFDIIMTSDTVPLARVFLENAWEKPLIIWVCNRLDYSNRDYIDEPFPDDDWYALLNKAADWEHVWFASYTPFEREYARRKGVDLKTNRVIRPAGRPISEYSGLSKTMIPPSIDKKETVFIYPRLHQGQLDFAQEQLAQRGIKTCCGAYNGPADLRGFKGIIYFPYVFSNVAMFENWHWGFVHFVPSEKFVLEQYAQRNPVRCFTMTEFNWCEWYQPAFRDLFVYFDSWDDLAKKINTTDYAEYSRRSRVYARCHRTQMVTAWYDLLSDVVTYCEKPKN